MNLNLIGNGFDLYHGLPSSYYYFRCLFNWKRSWIIWRTFSNVWISQREVGWVSKLRFTYGVEDFFWRDFEKRLGEIAGLWVEKTLLDDLGLEDDDAVDLEMYQYNNSEEIKKALSRWMKDIYLKCKVTEIQNNKAYTIYAY